MNEHWTKAVEAAIKAGGEVAMRQLTGTQINTEWVAPQEAALRAALPHLVEAVIADARDRKVAVTESAGWTHWSDHELSAAAARLAKGEG